MMASHAKMEVEEDVVQQLEGKTDFDYGPIGTKFVQFRNFYDQISFVIEQHLTFAKVITKLIDSGGSP